MTSHDACTSGTSRVLTVASSQLLKRVSYSSSSRLWNAVCVATERLENELCCISRYLWALLILQPFRHFIYVTTHSQTLPLLHLRHSSLSNTSFASCTSQALHLIHLASRPWMERRLHNLPQNPSSSQCIGVRVDLPARHFNLPQNPSSSQCIGVRVDLPARHFKQTRSARKVMCTVFWDRRGIIIVDFLTRGETVNAVR